jgi:transaldolase / glucose-6-phosphate isomerase
MTTPKTETTANRLAGIRDHGQSVWLDFIRRSMITSGGLKKLVDEDALGGVTSNPAIFEKAIAGSDDYKDAIQEISKDPHLSPKRIFEILAIKDIQDAADVLRPVYDRTKSLDGYVSLEVAPDLAHDTEGTLAEARRLWKEVARPNVMIKVPATPAGVPAIRQLLTEGININVTLLFAREAYEGVAQAFVDGVEARVAKGEPVDRVASVASFFVSRIDTLVDTWIAEKAKTASGDEKAKLESLLGKVAVANAKIAYQSYKKIFSGPRWDALKAKNAQVQRVLWASTGTKNPHYSDVLYVEELIGPDTVNTMPPDTLSAFRDHGKLRASLEEDVEGAARVLADLDKAGISLKKATDELLVDAVNKFVEPFEKLLKAVERRAREANKPRINGQTYKLPAALATAVADKLKEWDAQGGTRGLFAGDAKLWTGQDEANWIGWIGVVEQQCSEPGPRQQVREEAKKEGYSHALLLGMGGSSLCPEVWKETFGRIPGSPELHVLDSTDPAQVAAIEKKIDLKKTIFIVSSKSGSTLEPNIFKAYFFDKAKQAVGADAAKHFIAVTDPGSTLEKEAKADGFRHIFPGLKSIGGRYSALSNFGIVPAAVMGLPFEQLLDEADRMLHACTPGVPAEENPGLTLGTILGVAASQGRDKLTIVASPGIYDLGAWLEQLLAESTGKEGKGIVPVDREAVGAPASYGSDRVFAYLRLSDAPDAKQDAAVAELEKAGQPVVRIEVATKYDLAEEFVRWEIATAIAGSILKINPFNQPDVEASKIATKAITSEYEKTGSLPAEAPFFEGNGIKLFSDPKNVEALQKAVGGSPSFDAYVKAHLDRIKDSDYFALLAYVQMTAAHEELLQKPRHSVRDKKKVATVLGFGPRFLHSTGQAYKGGPNSGVFLQVTCDDANDLPVPGAKYTFGIVKAAQARGDFQVLAERGRRALRVHLGADVAAGLKTLTAAIEKALA